ncbi:MAG: hypothetical protein PCFJNLEI_01884 [Verrucomicrobiae bacterium]|nr:hypothetical protein [Verrucomicrobiae bacterium]
MEAFDGIGGVFEADEAADANFDFVNVERFGEEVVSAGIEAGLHLLGGVAGGQDENGDVLGVFLGAESAAEGQAVEAGHADVGDDEVGLVGQGQREGVATVVGGHDLVATAGEDFGEDLTDFGFIINDKNCGWFWWCGGHGEMGRIISSDFVRSCNWFVGGNHP